MRLKALLLRAQIALVVNDYGHAEICTVAAGELARALGNSGLLGKCSYWRGIAELNLRKYPAAALSFEESRQTCKGKYIEWESVEKMLSLAQGMAPQMPLTAGPRTPFRMSTSRWKIGLTPTTARSNISFCKTPHSNTFRGFSGTFRDISAPTSAVKQSGSLSLEAELAAANEENDEPKVEFELETDDEPALQVEFDDNGEEVYQHAVRPSSDTDDSENSHFQPHVSDTSENPAGNTTDHSKWVWPMENRPLTSKKAITPQDLVVHTVR